MRPRLRLATFMLLVPVVGAAAGLLAIRLRSPSDLHAHPAGGYFLHNESEWPVTVRIESPTSEARYVRLEAGGAFRLPGDASRIAIMLRNSAAPDGSAAAPDGSKDYAALPFDLGRMGSVADDYGSIRVVSRRCLAVRMRLGRGDDSPVGGGG